MATAPKRQARHTANGGSLDRAARRSATASAEPERRAAHAPPAFEAEATSFFHDPSAFAVLASSVLAKLVHGRAAEAPIRIWVPGCSTGQEAYSIAIALAEQLALARSNCQAQIFATDLDESAVEIARAGSYPQTIAREMSSPRLQSFFAREGHRYTIAWPLRRSLVFATHDLTADPPLSRMDLISCRNVLGRLQPHAQARLLSLFHYALKAGGYLFLGRSDDIAARAELFAPVSKRWRIFRSARLGTRASLDFLQPQPQPLSAAPPPSRGMLAANGALGRDRRAAAGPEAAQLAEQQLLEHLVTAALTVRSDGEIVRSYGVVDRYLKPPAGKGPPNVLALARSALKSTLLEGLGESVRRNRRTVLETLYAKRGAPRQMLRITFKPVRAPNTSDRLWIIIFEDTAKAVDKEVISTNRRLQSANEALATSKEQLHSMNEELTTLNAHLQDKVQELLALNDDLDNLLVSTDIATVFLDAELRIKRFTKASSRVLNLQPGDFGRPMSHIATNLVAVDLAREARRVLDTSMPVEKEVTSQEGRHYFLRVLAYRTQDSHVGGVALSLIDLTTLRQAERQLTAAREQVAEDLRRMTRLHELGERLASTTDTPSILQEILRATIEITDAPIGIIQECSAQGPPTIAAHVGLERPMLEHVAQAEAGAMNACGQTTSSAQRRLVELTRIPPEGALLRSALQNAGIQALQSTPLADRSGRLLGIFSTFYRTSHQFPESELRWLDLLARHAESAIERLRSAQALARSRDDLERRVAERTEWLTLLHEISVLINEAPTWDAALQRVLQRLCKMEEWQIGYVYLPDPEHPDSIAPAIACVGDERFRLFHEACERQRYARGEPLPGQVYAQGVPVWANDREDLLKAIPLRAQQADRVGLRAGVALPIVVGQHQEVIGVLELFSDRSHPRNDWFDNLMPAIGDQIGRILERERTTAQMAELVWREQQDLLHTLHDVLGQTLTGLGMLSAGLRQRLIGVDQNAADTATEIAKQAQQALEQVRQLSRSLFPVDVEAESLTAALRELASITESLHKIHVRVEGDIPHGFGDGGTATQLYRIAQEAVTNAVKHAQARTIAIQIDGHTTMLRLRIADDGVGIGNATKSNGIGLQIMRYRAHAIGGIFTVERGSRGGTIVTCTVRTAPGRGPRISSRHSRAA